MGDDDYVKELKQGAVGAKLPTMLDLNPAGDTGISDLDEAASGEDTAASGKKQNADPGQISSEIYAIISSLHAKGESLDRIYDALDSRGYQYEAIEPVFVDFLNKTKPVPRAAAYPSSMPMQAAPVGLLQRTGAQAPPSPRTMFQPQQGAKAAFTPQRAQIPAQQIAARPALQTFNAAQPQQKKPSSDNLEIVEVHQVIQAGASEEVPTTLRQPAPEAFAPQKQAAPEKASGTEGSGEFAPLFVKVGKYRESLETLNDLENYLRAMSRLLGLVEELEKVRVMNISALNKMHNKALVTTIRLSSGLLKPKGMSLEGTRESEVELNKLGDVISDLSKELSVLRQEVDKLGR